MFMLWFAVIMTGVLGGIFAMLSKQLCAPMAALDMGWMYFALMGLLAILLGTFGSVFNTFSGLYLAKENLYSSKCRGWSDIVYLAESKRL